MRIITKRIPMPEAVKYSDYNGNNEEDLSGMDELPVEVVIYWYENWGYEGRGQALALKDGKWYLHSLSHCSCNDPVSGFRFNSGEDTPEAWLKRSSEDLQKEITGIVTAAKFWVTENENNMRGLS